MNRRGVCYDVGRYLYGDWRPDFDPEIVHRELSIMKDDLHCNTVRICSRDLRRLETAAEDALQQGLEVWVSPELWNKSPGATLAYTARAADVAERLRRRHPGQLVMSVGSELSLFMQGIIPGRSLWTRMRNAFRGDTVTLGQHDGPLNDYLSRVVEAVRRRYEGPITYASLPFENVKWDAFDFVGLDHYRATRIKDRYADMLVPFVDQGKPVAVMEFGCCTYQGAEDAGGQAFNIVDIKSLVLHRLPVVGRWMPPRLKGPYVRDEALQAREIVEALETFDAVGVDAAFVFTFVYPQNPYSDRPEHDLDMASYSLVKFYADGRCGSVYPNLTWDPKESFAAVAGYYGR